MLFVLLLLFLLRIVALFPSAYVKAIIVLHRFIDGSYFRPYLVTSYLVPLVVRSVSPSMFACMQAGPASPSCLTREVPGCVFEWPSLPPSFPSMCALPQGHTYNLFPRISIKVCYMINTTVGPTGRLADMPPPPAVSQGAGGGGGGEGGA